MSAAEQKRERTFEAWAEEHMEGIRDGIRQVLYDPEYSTEAILDALTDGSLDDCLAAWDAQQERIDALEDVGITRIDALTRDLALAREALGLRRIYEDHSCRIRRKEGVCGCPGVPAEWAVENAETRALAREEERARPAPSPGFDPGLPDDREEAPTTTPLQDALAAQNLAVSKYALALCDAGEHDAAWQGVQRAVRNVVYAARDATLDDATSDPEGMCCPADAEFFAALRARYLAEHDLGSAAAP